MVGEVRFKGHQLSRTSKAMTCVASAVDGMKGDESWATFSKTHNGDACSAHAKAVVPALKDALLGTD